MALILQRSLTLQNRLKQVPVDDITQQIPEGRRTVGDILTLFGMLKTYQTGDLRAQELSPETIAAKWKVSKSTLESLVKYYNIYGKFVSRNIG